MPGCFCTPLTRGVKFVSAAQACLNELPVAGFLRKQTVLERCLCACAYEIPSHMLQVPSICSEFIWEHNSRVTRSSRTA